MVKFTTAETCYGKALIATNKGDVCAFLFLAENEEKMMQLFYSKFPKSTEVPNFRYIPMIENILQNKTINFQLNGTNFQKTVWNALLTVKSCISYQELANKIENPKAVRAVANAVAKNLLHFIIPCHLVVKSTGEIGKYAGGIELKKHLIANFPLNKCF